MEQETAQPGRAEQVGGFPQREASGKLVAPEQDRAASPIPSWKGSTQPMWKDLLAQGKMARLCQLAARLILVLGLVTAAAEAYLLWTTYHYLIQAIMAPGYSGFSSAPQGLLSVRMAEMNWSDLAWSLAFLFGTIATTIFYSLLLSLIGRVLSALAGPAPAGAGASGRQISASEDESADGLIFQSLDEAELKERSRDGRHH
ncbi:hypothetical protein [Thermogemmatispora sp.]|uniref:hypothetical protein n=1 Tax=Thermogemmatispora sp. TaxID=1968838 RepID=UPI001D5BCA25|nr:hypothetical protein [Thermogemmatispora sp.]MBX5451479.1 hypothetical protein [Thermogemmatispora sp.]